MDMSWLQLNGGTTWIFTLVYNAHILKLYMVTLHLRSQLVLYLKPWILQLIDAVKWRQQLLQLLKDNISKAQERMKFYVDNKKSKREFEANDLV